MGIAQHSHGSLLAGPALKQRSFLDGWILADQLYFAVIELQTQSRCRILHKSEIAENIVHAASKSRII